MDAELKRLIFGYMDPELKRLIDEAVAYENEHGFYDPGIVHAIADRVRKNWTLLVAAHSQEDQVIDIPENVHQAFV